MVIIYRKFASIRQKAYKCGYDFCLCVFSYFIGQFLLLLIHKSNRNEFYKIMKGIVKIWYTKVMFG